VFAIRPLRQPRRTAAWWAAVLVDSHRPPADAGALSVEYVDLDWQVVEAGRWMPLAYCLTQAQARRFMADCHAWQREERRRPAANDPRYA